MNSRLYVEKFGQGPALVLIHGWGLNGGVWLKIQTQLAQHFTIYCVDLPGFGYSHEYVVEADVTAWTDAVMAEIDEPAVWLGWSLGGLVATQAAIDFPEKVTGLITVDSSPLFAQTEKWPGIKSNVMTMFTGQLVDDFELTLERFLAIQAMGSDSAKQDIKSLKNVLATRPLPHKTSLHDGLMLLNNVDLRSKLSEITMPFLRLYGRLDSLVPKRVISLVDDLSPESEKYIFDKASHAPFISHAEEFYDVIFQFLNQKTMT